MRRELAQVLGELVAGVERQETSGLIAIAIDREGTATVQCVNVDDASACWILEQHVLRRRLALLGVV